MLSAAIIALASTGRRSTLWRDRVPVTLDNNKSENKKMPATKAGKLERFDDGRRTRSRSRAQ
jgi:hypothetical protein